MTRFIDQMLTQKPTPLPWVAPAPPIPVDHRARQRQLQSAPVLLVDQVAEVLSQQPAEVVMRYVGSLDRINPQVPAGWIEYRAPRDPRTGRALAWPGASVEAVGLWCTLESDAQSPRRPLVGPGLRWAATLYLRVQGRSVGPVGGWELPLDPAGRLHEHPRFQCCTRYLDPPADLRRLLWQFECLADPALVTLSLMGTPLLSLSLVLPPPVSTHRGRSGSPTARGLRLSARVREDFNSQVDRSPVSVYGRDN